MAKLLAFTDSHGDHGNVIALLEAARGDTPDLLVSSGDITYFGQGYSGFFGRLGTLKLPLYYVPGNHEGSAQCDRIEREFPYLVRCDYQTREATGVRIVGLPGVDELWPRSREDEAIFERAVRLWSSVPRDRPLILLTHFPPAGNACDGEGNVDGGGSKVVRKIVDWLKPEWVICGHYHTAFGREDLIGPSRIVNPGPRGRLIVLPTPPR